MSVKETILERRSVRKYTDKPVRDEDINDIVEAGLYAPSAIDLQHWYYVVIKSPEEMESFREYMCEVSEKFEPILKERFKNHPAAIAETRVFQQTLGGAQFVVLAFFYRDDYPDFKGAIQGVSAGIQNMLLCAWEKGIGSCWMTAPIRAGLDNVLTEKYSKGHGEFVAAVTFGYPEIVPKAPRRKEGRVTFL